MCKTVVEDINPKLPNELKRQGIKIKRALKIQYRSDFQLENKKTTNWKFWINVVTLDDLWESYDNLNSLITKIDNSQKDKKIIR